MRNSDMQPSGPPQPARFAELVKLHTQGRRFLDSDREMKLLEEGVTHWMVGCASVIVLGTSLSSGLWSLPFWKPRGAD